MVLVERLQKYFSVIISFYMFVVNQNVSFPYKKYFKKYNAQNRCLAYLPPNRLKNYCSYFLQIGALNWTKSDGVFVESYKILGPACKLVKK